MTRWLRAHPSLGPYLCMVAVALVGYMAFSSLVNDRSSERRRVDLQTCTAGQAAVTAVDQLERSIEGIVAPILDNDSTDPRVVEFRERTEKQLAAARAAITKAGQDCSKLPQP